MIHNPKNLIPHAGFKFYTPLAMLFVSLTLVVNIITQKIVPAGFGLFLTAGDYIYPLIYAISLILTEVYGYALSRRIIWLGWCANLLASLIIAFAILLPSAPSWKMQAPYALILGRAPLILVASFLGFISGEFASSFLLAKQKVWLQGRYFWLRALNSTFVGQVLDTIIFDVMVFWQILSWSEILILSVTCYVFKICYQLLLTPLLYVIADFIKKREAIDIYDKHTNFNPFRLRLE